MAKRRDHSAVGLGEFEGVEEADEGRGADGDGRLAVGEDAAQGQFVLAAVLGETTGQRDVSGRAAGDVAQVAEDERAGDLAAFGDGFVVHDQERRLSQTASK
ncbi:hypothetical protein OG873_22500 [Streptomyces violaceus]|uniref:Uncharacterized protein n=1 Tax=Streptomyces violaceus TaxID=1936 RepID=A0ABZ1NVI7_STRVL